VIDQAAKADPSKNYLNIDTEDNYDSRTKATAIAKEILK